MRQKSKTQLFLIHLLVLLALVGWPYFGLFETSILGLIVSLAIDGAKSISTKVIVGFSR